MKTDRDLRAFCAPPEEEGRYELCEPLSVGEFTFATDGRILVRVGETGAKPVGLRQPDLPELVAGIPAASATAWKNPPKVQGPPPDCDPWWRKVSPCPICKGDKNRVCEDCLGAGEFLQADAAIYEEVEFVGSTFSRRYLWMVSQLPGCRVCRGLRSDRCVYVLWFRFDGGIGVFAAMT